MKEKCQLMRSEDLRTATCHLLGGVGGWVMFKKDGRGSEMELSLGRNFHFNSFSLGEKG